MADIPSWNTHVKALLHVMGGAKATRAKELRRPGQKYGNPFVTGPPSKSDSVMTGLHFGTSVLQLMAAVRHDSKQRIVAERVRCTRHDMAHRPAARRLVTGATARVTDVRS